MTPVPLFSNQAMPQRLNWKNAGCYGAEVAEVITQTGRGAGEAKSVGTEKQMEICKYGKLNA